MSTKNININFNTNAKDEAAKTATLDASINNVTQRTQRLVPTVQQSNMQLQSMSRIVQDAPFGFMAIGNNITFMAEQMAMAKAQGVGMSAMLKGMLSSLTGAGGIVFGISVFVSLLTVLTRNTGAAKEKLEEFTLETLVAKTDAERFADSLKKVNKELGELSRTELQTKLKQLETELKNTIASLRTELEREVQYGGVLYRWLFGDDPEELKRKSQELLATITSGYSILGGDTSILGMKNADIKRARERQETAHNYAELVSANRELVRLEKERDDLLKLGTEEIRKQAEGENKETKAIKEKTQALKELEPYLSLLYGRTVSAVSGGQMGTIPNLRGPFNMKEVAPQQAPGFTGKTEAELRKEFKTFDVIAQSAANTMRDMFGEAWDSIFGHANSLLEIFLQNIAEGLLSLASENVAKGIFGFLMSFIPGGGAVGALAGQPIVLQIGPDTVANFVMRGNNYIEERGIS